MTTRLVQSMAEAKGPLERQAIADYSKIVVIDGSVYVPLTTAQLRERKAAESATPVIEQSDLER